MLDERETLRLIRAAKEGDSSAKEALLSANTPLLKSILRRYLNKGVEYEDLFELACMGLLKAISGFDESFGVRFSTYAVPMIAGEIKRFLRDDGSVKVSRALKKTARDINGYIEQYLQEHGTQPSVKEIADQFAIDESEVVFALGSSHMPVSIYEEAPHKDGNAQSETGHRKAPGTGKDDRRSSLLPRYDAERSRPPRRCVTGADLPHREQDPLALPGRTQKLNGQQNLSSCRTNHRSILPIIGRRGLFLRTESKPSFFI